MKEIFYVSYKIRQKWIPRPSLYELQEEELPKGKSAMHTQKIRFAVGGIIFPSDLQANGDSTEAEELPAAGVLGFTISQI